MSQPKNLNWIVWITLSTAFFLSFFHRVAPAVIADQLMAEFDTGAVAIGGLASIYFYIYLLMQIPTGALADTVGPRTTVAVGSIVAGLGALLFALAWNLPVAFVGRFLIGLGVSVAFICTLKAQTVWFPAERFATMSGLLAIVGTAGAIVATTPLAASSDAFGWRPAFVASAIASIVVAVLIWSLVKDAPDGESGRPDKPLTHRMSLRQSVPVVWRNRQTWLCFTIHFSLFGGYLAFVGLWGAPFLMHVYDLSRIQAANWMIVVTVAFAAGSFLVGVLSDRLRRRKPPVLIGATLFVIMWLSLVLWPGGPPPYAWTMVALIVASAGASAYALGFAVVKESNPPGASGLAMATANIGGILGVALLQPLIGHMLDSSWEGTVVAGARVYAFSAYRTAFWAFVIVGLCGLIATLFMRDTRREARNNNQRPGDAWQ